MPPSLPSTCCCLLAAACAKSNTELCRHQGWPAPTAGQQDGADDGYLGDVVVELLRKLREVDGNPYVIVAKLGGVATSPISSIHGDA